MSSVFDRLRSGKPVEFGEGLAGRINPADKTLEMSDGRKIYVGDDEDFFPSSDESRRLSQEKESIERGIAGRPGGEFLHQLTTQGIIGAGADWINYFGSNKEDYSRNKLAKQAVSERISKESPWTSAAATATSFIPDLALTRGMSGLVAGPTLAAAHAGPRIVQKPFEVAGEAAVGGVIGKIIDMGASGLQKIAQRRAENRAIPQRQAEVTAQNKLGQEAVETANLEAKQRFNALQQETKNKNAQKLENYQNELIARKNKIVQEENEFSRLSKEREDAIIALKNQKAKEKAEWQAEQARIDREYEIEVQRLKLENKKLNENKILEREARVIELKNKAAKEKYDREIEQARIDREYEREIEQLKSDNKRLNDGKKFEREARITELKNKAAKEKYDREIEQARIDREYENEITKLKNENKAENERIKFERETKITELKNKRNQEKAQREEEIRRKDYEYEIELKNAQDTNKRLTEEFKESQKKYQEELKNLPEVQDRVQKVYSDQVLKNVEKIEKSFPKGARIVVDDINIPSFIDSFITKTGRAGTIEGRKASKVLSSLFPEGEIITSRELLNRYKAVEELIQRSNTAEKSIYVDFKTHLGEKIPSLLENNIAFSRVVPSLQKQIEKDIDSVFKSLKLKEGFSSPKEIASVVKSNVRKYFSELTPKDFVNKIRSKEFRDELAAKFLTPYDMSPSAKTFGLYDKSLSKGKGSVPAYYREEYNEVLAKLKNKLENALAKAEIKMIASDVDAAKKLGRGVEKTLGMAPEISPPLEPTLPQMTKTPARPESIPPIPAIEIPPPPQGIPLNLPQRPQGPPPVAPIELPLPVAPEPLNLPQRPQGPPPVAPIELPLPVAPEPLNLPQRPQGPPPVAPIELPPGIAPPPAPEYPMRPQMAPMPEAPIPQTFTPQELPTLAPAQGALENIGDFLESNPLAGKGVFNNPYAKLAGLKYLLGKAAIPVEVGYLGMKGLTSPTQAGEIARAGFKQAGIQAVAQIAQKYPSYHDGIVDDPRERRSLTKEIENDPEIPLQEKALLQSKINRGKSIFERIQ